MVYVLGAFIMSEETKRNRNGWKIFFLFIPVIHVFLIPVFLFVITYVENSLLSFTDRLIGYEYKFSKIVGEPQHITKQSYLQEREKVVMDLDGRSNLYPTDCPNSGADYYYFGEMIKPSDWFVDRCEVYIKCTWDDNTYESEKGRLSLITGPEKRYPLYSQNLFTFPSYIFIFDPGEYLYVLLDENENAIYYIYLLEIGNIENVVFDRSLAPQKRIRDSDVADKAPFGSYSY